MRQELEALRKYVVDGEAMRLQRIEHIVLRMAQLDAFIQ
jgi:hypothetical protein